MFDLTTLLSGVQTAGTLLNQVLSKRGTRVSQKINAVARIQEAINTTKIYITESKGNYLPNTTLSKLWLDAFTAMIPVNTDLAHRLRQKSKFWTDPQSWFKESGALELVPDLSELDDRCEELLIELDKRIS